MKYVLDASVAVAAFRSNEPLHAACVKRLTPLLRGDDSIVVPAIFRIEVASALARVGFTAAQVDRFAGGLLAHATEVTIGPLRARRIQGIAMATRLRAADAIYVWVAQHEGLPLVTADQEIQQRASALCRLLAP
jgi:predicted nucleic acid-binding protein